MITKYFGKLWSQRRFSNKYKTTNTIILTEGDMIMKNDRLTSDTFNNYFADIRKTLKLKKNPHFDSQSLFSITDYFKWKYSKKQRKVWSSRELIFMYFVCKTC